ncbi:SLAM family member 7 isoform X1 [Suricata suricatta]|uniref:SLAM family member 7 n=1 Tax=Suricata suricatta TaxID=37032 RepID=A0A673T9A8_SURSU|nr:SLAM family member 7 isoform X1 [Suricata suricatta]
MLVLRASFILLLLCQPPGQATSEAPKELVGDLGGSVTFPLKLPEIQIDSIFWTFNTTPLVTIEPKTPNRQANVIVTHSHNKERVKFPQGSYSLELSKLNKNDSGDYRMVIYSSSLKEPLNQVYRLRVYEHLSKPKVTMGLLNNKNGTCVTNLTCFVDQGGEEVTYSWESLGQASNESHNGSILPVSWRLGERDMSFICVVRNPISSNSSNPVFAWKLCEGAAADSESSTILAFLGVSLLIFAFALMPAILIKWREKRKVSESIEERKGMDTHQEIPNYYSTSGETSVYDMITCVNKTIPEEDPEKTLYFSVQIPQKETISEENAEKTLYSSVQIPQMMEKPHSAPTSPDTPTLFTHEIIN